jgi:hypothetical protein
MIIQIVVEDSMKDAYEQPGGKQAVEGAALRKLFELRDALNDRQSRATFSRGFIGTAKEQQK